LKLLDCVATEKALRINGNVARRSSDTVLSQTRRGSR